MLLFPPHSTLRSIVAAAVRNGNFDSVRHAVACLGGNVPLDGYLGEHAERIGIGFFQDRDAAKILVRNHSHFGIFGNLLSVEDEDEFRDGLIHSRRGALRRARTLRLEGTLESEARRRCPQCVDEDLSQYGFAHWRLYHQWPVARHCVVHGCELTDHCGSCGHLVPRDAGLALPHDACERCGRSDFDGQALEEPPLYRPTLQLLGSMLAGQVPATRPARREASAKNARRVLFHHMHLGGLVGLTCASWRCEMIAELADMFGCATPDEMADLGGIGQEDTLPAMLVVAVMAIVLEYS